MRAAYEQIMAKVRALTRKAESAKRAEVKRVARAVERIRKLMKEHGVSIGHLSGSTSGRGSASKKVGKSKLPPTDGRLKVKPKYRHPKSKETWSGRGKTPRWLVAEMKSGKSKDSFLIKS
jgi:DNA-binding protein H-NS